MKVGLKDLVKDALEIRSSNLLDYMDKYKTEREFINELKLKKLHEITPESIEDSEVLSETGKSNLLIKTSLLKALISNVSRTEQLGKLYETDEKEARQVIINEIINEAKIHSRAKQTPIIIHESLKNLDTKYLKYLGCRGVKGDTIGNIIYSTRFIKSKLTEQMKMQLKQDIIALFKEVLEQEKENVTFLCGFLQGYKLNELGEMYGLSGERVRQRIAKLQSNLKNIVHEIICYMSVNGIVDLSKLEDELGVAVDIIKSVELSRYKQSELFNWYITDKQIGEKVEELESAIYETLEQSIWKDTIESNINLKIDSLGLGSIISVNKIFNLLKRDYIVEQDTVLSKEIANKDNSIAIRMEVVKHLYKNGIILTRENIQNVIEKTNEITGRDREMSEQFVANSLIKHCLLKNKNEYIHPDLVDISDDLIKELYAYIEERRGIELLYSTIYNEFENKLVAEGIYNEHFLHGVMSKYMSDTLELKPKKYFLPNYDGTVEKVTNLIDKLSIKEKRVVALGEFGKYVGEDGYKSIITNLKESDNLIYYNNNMFYSVSNLEIDSSTKDAFKDIIEEKIDEGLFKLNCDSLYSEMAEHEEYIKILDMFKVSNGRALKGVIINIFKDEYICLQASNTIIRRE